MALPIYGAQVAECINLPLSPPHALCPCFADNVIDLMRLGDSLYTAHAFWALA